MKNFILCLSTFFFSQLCSAQLSWSVLSAPKNPNDYITSSFINDNEGWLIDNTSALWHTSNGCAALDTISSGMNFLKLDFISSDIGYGLDAANAYKTMDGGVSWTALTLPGSIQSALYFLNKDTGFVSGYYQYYKTTDGGATWVTLTFPGITGWTDYSFINDSVGCAVTTDYYFEEEIYRTTDGGITWSGVWGDQESHLTSIYFSSKDTGWACGVYDFGLQRSEIIRSVDGGQTWEVVFYDDNDNAYLSDVRVKHNNKDGYAISSAYDDAVTNDGGGNWGVYYDVDTLSLPLNEFFLNQTLDGFNDLYMSGNYGTLVKWKKDTTQWEDISGRICSDINDFSFTSDSHGWMATNSGILKTSDAGNTWSAGATPHSSMNMIDAVDDNFIFAGDTYDYPHFYRSTDGGQTWGVLDTNYLPVHMSAQGIQMIDQSTGYILSGGWYNNWQGSIYKTTDGGNTWQNHVVGNANFSANWVMYFLNATEGWILEISDENNGGTNYLYHTTDGGTSWTNIYQYTGNTFQYYNSLFFRNSLDGYFATSGNKFYKTSNGGTTWSADSIAGATDYRSIFFSDSLNGWCLTKNDLYQTIDGGINWSVAYHSTTELYDVTQADTSVFARGFYGFLVKGSTPLPCHADFTLMPDTANIGFYWGYNLSTGSDLIYSWTWGDGTTSTGQFPTHLYVDSGFYNICLMVFDTVSSCADTFCADYTIMKTADMMQIHEINFVDYPLPAPSENSNGMSCHISPNPFSVSTSISFTSQHDSHTTITLFDVAGRKIKTLLDENLAEGNHEVNLTRESLGAGVYFLRLKTGSATVTKKIVVE